MSVYETPYRWKVTALTSDLDWHIVEPDVSFFDLLANLEPAPAIWQIAYIVVCGFDRDF
jgi:hypothetical protein